MVLISIHQRKSAVKKGFDLLRAAVVGFGFW